MRKSLNGFLTSLNSVRAWHITQPLARKSARPISAGDESDDAPGLEAVGAA